jgi:ribosomal protein L29
MKLDEMKALQVPELEDKISDWKRELIVLRVQADIQKKAEKVHMFRLLRKQVARAYTLIRQKQIEEMMRG